MGKKAGEAMYACAVLGAAYSSGCAPEGAAPVEPCTASGIAKAPSRRNAHVEAVLKLFTQRFSRALP